MPPQDLTTIAARDFASDEAFLATSTSHPEMGVAGVIATVTANIGILGGVSLADFATELGRTEPTSMDEALAARQGVARR
ncbi:MAG: hypothetical protein LC792_20965 [Actinobacteria bacterium]|nr:hypothetical protein [Actinomycetota bacterium]